MDQTRIVKFSQIVDRLPDDFWAKAIHQRSHGKYADEAVLHIPGDAEFRSLDLDDVSTSIATAVQTTESIFLVLVEGNLAVDQWVGNQNTDGAANLIVKGDLRARHAILGGQQVYVLGDMTVEGLFWGDYNHGTLTVCGKASADMFIATDGYHLDLRGEQHFTGRLVEDGAGGGDWELLDFDTLADLIDPACLTEDPDLDHVTLLRDSVLERVKNGQPVLRQAGLTEGPVQRPTLFTDRDVTIDNILELARPTRILESLEAESVPKFQFWTGDTLCRVVATGRDNEIGAQRIVYLQNDTHAMICKVVLEEKPRSLWRKLGGKPLAGLWRMSFEGRRFDNDGDEDWHAIEPDPRSEGNSVFPEEFRPLLAVGWNALLDGAAIYDRASCLIDPQEVRRLLALPVVEPYDDFYDDDTCGFWSGQFFCAFRQEGVLYDDEPQPALLRVSREYTHADGRDLVEAYFFAVRRQHDGKDVVFITYKDDEDSSQAQLPLSFLGGRHLELAGRAFNSARRNLDRANRELIEDGIPPNWDDGFAIKHWRKRGFIRRHAPSGAGRTVALTDKATSPPAAQPRSHAVEDMYQRLERLGFYERASPSIATGNGVTTIILDAERKTHRLAASIIERADKLTLDISFYFDADSWDAVRLDIEATIARILDSKNATATLLVLADDLQQLEDQTVRQAGTSIELTVPEPEPDQTFEMVTVRFTRDLPSMEAQAEGPDDVVRDRPDRSSQDDFLQRIGWNGSDLRAWQISIALATRPPIEWTTKRNALQPDDMWLALTLSSFSPWKIQLKRHDRVFLADWTDHGVTVESEQLRYRTLMKWPQIANPADLPHLVRELEALLSTNFARAALITIPRADKVVRHACADWLSDICDTVEFIGDSE